MEQVIVLSRIPPTLNNLFPTVGRRRIRSKEYAEWAEASAWEVRSQRPRKFLDDVELLIEMRRPRANSDVDNRIKAPKDLLTGLVYADDRQVVDVRCRWADIDGCRITVRALEGA
jgi:Holliday junction resolvase RusA-like endonuclease